MPESTPRRAAHEAKDELVRAILDLIQRSYATDGPSGKLTELADFFRRLDDRVLRDIAHAHGLFEAILEPEPEEREEPPED